MFYKTTRLQGEKNHLKGAFYRQPNKFTTPFGRGEGNLPVGAGRYRLIWSAACPWATRQMIALKLLGLESVISAGLVDPVRPRAYAPDARPIPNGGFDIDMPGDLRRFRLDWAFTLDPAGLDPVLGVRYLSDLYFNADPAYSGRFTVPAVVDVQTRKVVNNDYFNLTYYWELEWKDFHRKGAPDLYPQALRPDIDELNDVIFHEINNGVYKAGFARSQEAYEDAFNVVFYRLDTLEKRLEKSRYLFGAALTDSDIRLYVTLIRFDFAYYNVFRLNKRRLADYPALFAYTRDLYQIPAFRDSTMFEHIKRHYHICCDPGNIFGIVPKGPEEAVFDLPHNRERL